MIRPLLRNALREPLLHFLAAGAVLFVLMATFGGEDPMDRSITIDEPQVRNLATQWEQTWRRPPSPQELDSLIRDYIKEEIYFREGMRLGLDIDDPIIRRRLRTKMEFLATAEVENREPSGAELQQQYDRNKTRYAQKAEFSFDQKFLGEDPDDAKATIAALNQNKSVTTQSLSVAASMDKAPFDAISRDFGDVFANGLREQPVGMWSGPVRSGFGWHAVRVRAVSVAAVPPLSSIRQRVSNDWRADSRAAREAAAYQALLDGYTIRIARP
nr:peptidylprolyl isomerase [uncultured Sphingorhabdus sp.]